MSTTRARLLVMRQRSTVLWHGLRMVALSLVIGGVLAACASAGGGDPAKIVEQYLQAKVSGDKDTMSHLLCSAMEANLNQEAQSFASMQVALEDMSCQRDGDTDVVRCSGNIVATYGTENRSFPLGGYHVVQEDGEWKWCGEAR